MLMLRFNESVVSFFEAYQRGERRVLNRLLSGKGWTDSWQNFEMLASDVEKHAAECWLNNFSADKCVLESAFGLEYSDANPLAHIHIHRMHEANLEMKLVVHPSVRSSLRDTSEQSSVAPPKSRLKLAFISSDFGIHPVSSLFRGVLQMIDKSIFEVFCFSITDNLGWW